MGRAHRLLAALAAGMWAAMSLAAPQSPDDLLSKARSAFGRKDYAEAQRLALRVVNGYPGSDVAVDAWLVAIDSLRERDRLPQAFQECEKLLALHPRTRHRPAILGRELEIGKALAHSHVRVLFCRFPRLKEGVDALEKLVEHAPYGPLAADAVLAIAGAYYDAGDYETARDQYDRLLRFYPDSGPVTQARIRRALCGLKLVRGPLYDRGPAEEARKELEALARRSPDGELARQSDEMRDILAQGEYEAGLYYFRRHNIEGGMRYLESVILKYPGSIYAAQAREILEESIIRKSPDTPYAMRAQRFLAQLSAEKAEEKP